MDKSDIYSIGWLMALYVYLIVISNFIPEGPTRSTAGALGIFIVIGGIFVQDIAFMYMTNPYPYLLCRLSPSGNIIRLFVEDIISQRISTTLWSTRLKLKWVVKMKFYGKVKELVINHEYPWAKRTRFRPGMCSYLDYVVKHPNTEFVVLYEYPQGSFEIDHANPVPVFRLKEASGDYFLSPIPLSVALKISGGNPKEVPVILKQGKVIDQLKAALTEALRSGKEWHKTSIQFEEIVGQQENELRGLLESKTDHMGAVVQHMFAIREEQLTIENALKKYTRPKISFDKWLALTVMLCIGLTFAWVMRDHIGGVGIWLKEPINMGFAFGVIMLFCLLLYYLAVPRGKK